MDDVKRILVFLYYAILDRKKTSAQEKVAKNAAAKFLSM